MNLTVLHKFGAGPGRTMGRDKRVRRMIFARGNGNLPLLSPMLTFEFVLNLSLISLVSSFTLFAADALQTGQFPNDAVALKTLWLMIRNIKEKRSA